METMSGDGQRVLLHPLKKMSSMRDDWNPPGLTCLSECLQLNRKTHKTHKKCIFWGHFVPCATSNWNIKIEERFPQRSPCPLSHKSNLKSEAEPLIHISVTLAGPHSGPQPSNNIHCFLPLKKEHPLHSILDVGGSNIWLENTRFTSDYNCPTLSEVRKFSSHELKKLSVKK